MPRLIQIFRLRNGLPAIAALIFAITAACSGSSSDNDSVTGQVVDVVPRDIIEFESLTLVDDEGQTWEFTGGHFSGFTPSHLQEHKALREPVRVWYVEVGHELRVTRIEDG